MALTSAFCAAVILTIPSAEPVDEPDAAVRADAYLINEEFEKRLEPDKSISGWDQVWSREPGTGKLDLVYDYSRRYDSRMGTGRCAHIKHTGSLDWSFQRSEAVATEPGRLFRIDARVKRSRGT